ncbi:hypothetical protein BU632_10810 [Staphylococcus chromogenes]|nr:hypothetical protein BU642_07950 [Staphylococcus chromogenes]PTG94529.1 hypothetical protein BU632_10810 [Staphylococcus chromogenes]
MNLDTIVTVSIAISFVLFITLAIFIINKMRWCEGVKRLLLIMWNIVSTIFILLGTIVALIFIVFTVMLFASGKD